MPIDVSDKPALLNRLNAGSAQTLMDTLDIRYTDVGEYWLEASMPVGPRVHQPMGILHGGASAALAESVGSAASALLLDLQTHYPVGLELSIHHIRSVSAGTLIARAEIVHSGRSTHLWDITLRDEAGHKIAWAQLSMMILSRKH